MAQSPTDPLQPGWSDSLFRYSSSEFLNSSNIYRQSISFRHFFLIAFRVPLHFIGITLQSYKAVRPAGIDQVHMSSQPTQTYPQLMFSELKWTQSSTLVRHFSIIQFAHKGDSSKETNVSIHTSVLTHQMPPPHMINNHSTGIYPSTIHLHSLSLFTSSHNIIHTTIGLLHQPVICHTSYVVVPSQYAFILEPFS